MYRRPESTRIAAPNLAGDGPNNGRPMARSQLSSQDTYETGRLRNGCGRLCGCAANRPPFPAPRVKYVRVSAERLQNGCGRLCGCAEPKGEPPALPRSPPGSQSERVKRAVAEGCAVARRRRLTARPSPLWSPNRDATEMVRPMHPG